MKHNCILKILAIALATLYSSSAFAEHCPYTATQGMDIHVSSRACSQSEVHDMWNRFDFDKGDWDGGFGYYYLCNDSRPLQRTFNALYLMKYAPPSGWRCSTSSGNLLDWGYCWAGNSIDELDAGCYGNSSTVYGTTYYRSFDDRTILFLHFFYGLTVPERAGAIIHEARHAQGWCKHTTCSRCKVGTCDPTYRNGCRGFASSNGYGAYGFEVNYLSRYATKAVNSNKWLKTSASNRGKAIFATSFCSDPCTDMNSKGYVYDTCGN